MSWQPASALSPRDPADPRLGPVIRRLRNSGGQTQEDVAYHAGISVGALSQIEGSRANPSWTTVLRISEALEVSLPDFVAALERS